MYACRSSPPRGNGRARCGEGGRPTSPNWNVGVLGFRILGRGQYKGLALGNVQNFNPTYSWLQQKTHMIYVDPLERQPLASKHTLPRVTWLMVLILTNQRKACEIQWHLVLAGTFNKGPKHCALTVCGKPCDTCFFTKQEAGEGVHGEVGLSPVVRESRVL